MISPPAGDHVRGEARQREHHLGDGSPGAGCSVTPAASRAGPAAREGLVALAGSYPGISATPWATAHGAQSGTSASPSRPTGSLRVITARWSHTPRSLGWETVHAHSQARCGQPAIARHVSPTARTAGSLAS